MNIQPLSPGPIQPKQKPQTTATLPLEPQQPPDATEKPFQDLSSIYPTPSAGLADSQHNGQSGVFLESKETNWVGSIPNGVVIICVLSVINTIATFFQSTSLQTSNGLVNFMLILNLLLIFGLFTLHSFARVLVVIFSSLAVFSSLMGLFQMVDIQNRLAQQKETYTQQIQQIEIRKNLTAANQAKLDAARAKVAEAEKVTGAAITQAYLTLFFRLGYSSFVVIYLLRPSVKQKFE